MKANRLVFFIFLSALMIIVGYNLKEREQQTQGQIVQNDDVQRQTSRIEVAQDEKNLEIQSEVREGDFVYRLVSEKAEYLENSPVSIYAELEYVGDMDKIEIYHAASPFYFTMKETTRNISLGWTMNEPLIVTTLVKGIPLREEYSAQNLTSSKDDEENKNFQSRIKRNEFPYGHYFINGAASFWVITNQETKQKKDYQISTEIDFKVNQ